MAHPTVPGSRQAGMAYLALLIVVAGVGIGLGAMGTLWQTVSHREKEKELLFVGEQFRRAIQQYYEASPGDKKYPPNLESLLKDPRLPGDRHYLRRIYRDPLTNEPKWGLLQAPQGGVMGIHSLADGKPFKQSGFNSKQVEFEERSSYRQWEFSYLPNAAPWSRTEAPK